VGKFVNVFSYLQFGHCSSKDKGGTDSTYVKVFSYLLCLYYYNTIIKFQLLTYYNTISKRF